jgi:ribosomal protein S12 methylthiotransferase accessory factor
MSPEETLARVLPLASRIGVTRLADLTGLDRLRVPVYAAIRPNSRSLAAFQGKGATAAAAKASALMEAAEAYCAETMRPPLYFASRLGIAEIGPAVDVDRLPRSRSEPLDDAQPILWTAATDIVTGDPRFVPFEIVHADYACDGPAVSGCFSATTNGLASGNVFLEAVAHGLYEVIERDAVALWSLRSPAARAARRVDPDSIDCRACREILAQFEEAQIDVAVWDITTDIGLPAFHALVLDRTQSANDPEIGSGAHPSREVALMRALSEAAQSRATWISGSRDDYAPREYGSSARRARRAAVRDWMSAPARIDFRQVPTFDNTAIRDDISHTVSGLARAGLGQVLALDLTRPDIGIPVARVIVPGLEGVYQGGEFLPGERGKAALARRR